MHKLLYEPIVKIPIDSIELEGELVIPPGAKGIVVFAHGSGSSRHSPRNKYVARELRHGSLATLLVDLLSEEEDSYYDSRFDIQLLTERLIAITDWVTHNKKTAHLPLGYFGGSTGAAAAIKASIGAEDVVRTIVSRGGRVDLVYDIVDQLKVPTMLIVGQNDVGVRQANEDVFLKLKCRKELVEIPRAAHLFEEPGALERVSQVALTWFQNHLDI